MFNSHQKYIYTFIIIYNEIHGTSVYDISIKNIDNSNKEFDKLIIFRLSEDILSNNKWINSPVFPFKYSTLDEIFKMTFESKTIPKSIKIISDFELDIRVENLNKSKLDQHECKMCFNLAISLQLKGNYRQVKLIVNLLF